MRTDGFVLRLTGEVFSSQESPSVVCVGPELGTAIGPGVRLFAATLATTPESALSFQPLLHDSLLVAISGRIDNRNEVAEALGDPALKTQADCQLLAEAYARWGRGLAAKVIGEFAAVVVDFRNKMVAAVCDSLGARRILYCRQADQFWISSSLTLLLSSLLAGPELDHDNLVEFIARRSGTPREKTLFHGIHGLRTGETLSRSGNGRIEITTAWKPQEKDLRSYGANHKDAEYDEEFRSLLFAAVRAAARTREPLWTDLSGGLDSSTVTAVAHLLHQKHEIEAHPTIAFSVVHPSSPESDESAFQEAVLSLHPLVHTKINGDGLDYRQVAGIHCEPTPALTFKADLHKAIAEAAKKDGVRVNLSGTGGDQVLCNYAQCPPFSLGDYLKAGRLSRFAKEFKGYLERGERSAWVLLRDCTLRPRSVMGKPDRSVLPRWGSVVLNSVAEDVLHEDFLGGPRVFHSLAREHLYRSICAVTQVASSRLPPVPADVRFPYFYRPLVEFMLGLPWEHKISPWQDRIIQRRSLKGILPEEVRNRESKAQAAAVRTTALRDHWDQLQPYIQGEKLATLGIVRTPEFREACLRWRHGMRQADEAFLPTALLAEAWLQSSLPKIREVAPNHRSLQAFFTDGKRPAGKTI
jgi:asparagine synthase (glutamine-hydrolysing)